MRNHGLVIAGVLFRQGTILAAQLSPNIYNLPATTDELAKRVETAYTTCAFVSFKGEVSAPSGRVAFVSDMAPHKLSTRLFVEDRLVLALTLTDGRIEEYRPSSESPQGRTLVDAVLAYASPTPQGTDMVILRDGIDQYLCLVGSNFSSWIGRDSRHVEFLKDRITNGRLLPEVEVVGAYHCAVVVWEHKEEDYHRRDVFYFDLKSNFWIKWDTLHSDGSTEPTLERSRTHAMAINAQEPAAYKWRFSFGDTSMSGETKKGER